ncbi:DUF2029 domain-containing protein [bacterium]|nr:DUF2029 domain-containing protein [bacterium]
MRRPNDLILALVLFCGVYLWQRTTFPLWHIDLFHIQLAALSWHNDKPEMMYTDYAHFEEWIATYYRGEADRLGAWGDANAYFYPPFLAGALAPFADTHAFTWRNVVLAINILLLFVFAWQIVRLSGYQLNVRGFLWALALVLLTYPMARASKLGQLVPLQAALFWEGMLRIKHARVTSAALLGAVAAVKIFPAGWFVWPILRGKLKVVLWSAAIGVAIYAGAILTMGLDIHLRWLDAMREFGRLTFCYFTNQSPVGWFSRAVQGHQLMTLYAEPTLAITLVRIVTTAIFLGGAIWLLWRVRNFPAPFAIEQGLMISGLLLALPVAWEHYFLFALPPLAIAIWDEWKRGRLDFKSALLAVAAFFFTMKLTRFYGDSDFGRLMSGSQCFGLILFWAYLVMRVLEHRRVNLRPNFTA